MRRGVDSSNLAWVDYDEDSQYLVIGFHTGRTYEYYDVPAWLVDEMLAAGSVGGYFRVMLYYGYGRSADGRFRRQAKGESYDEITDWGDFADALEVQ